jgi:hypothetical protein
MNFWDDLRRRLKTANFDPTNFNPAHYDTHLETGEIPNYNAWRTNLAKNNPQLNNDHDYDLRGAFKAGFNPDARNHLPDTFKKPNHITFSDQSQYHTPEMPGGKWTDLTPHVPDVKSKKWSFKPSQFNLKMHGPEKLQNYFNNYEQNSKLDI